MLKQRKRFTENETRFFLRQIVEGIGYLHSNKIIHRDLKLANLLLSDMQVKIGDFGLAAKLEHDNDRKKTVCGTPNYIAPEILLGRKGVTHSYECDIWSIGVIMYTMIVGKPPFETTQIELTYERILNNQYTFPSEVPISEEAIQLIRAMLAPVPEKRPTPSAILAHPFFFGPAEAPPVPLPAPVPAPAPAPAARPVFQQALLALSPKKRSQVKHSSPKPKPASPQKQNSPEVKLPSPKHAVKQSSPAKSSPRRPLEDKTNGDVSSPRKEKRVNIVSLAVQQESDLIALKSRESDELAARMAGLSIAPPQVWITCWVNYTHKYGFAYKLSTGAYGVCFNDDTKIVLQPDGESYVYVEEDVESQGKLPHYPETLKKKVTLLRYFKDYLDRRPTDSRVRLPEHYQPGTFYLTKWAISDRVLVMRLNTGVVQSNFTDSFKLLFDAQHESICYHSVDQSRTMKLNAISDDYELVGRLQCVRDMISRNWVK